ncbi:MAG TPA: hypothetical protein VFP28_09590 [Gemmatimonadales bacterium]|nr:hypothetical protein [Gemmatimonadales bacterium]
MDPDLRELTEQVRAALIAAALAAYDEAGMRGLCAEGAWEVAVGAMRSFDLSHIVNRQPPDPA